jgi:hypothetical protein
MLARGGWRGAVLGKPDQWRVLRVDEHTIAHLYSCTQGCAQYSSPPPLYVWRHGPMGLRSLLVAPCVCGGLRYANLTRLDDNFNPSKHLDRTT